MTGHAGSTPAHPVCTRMLAAIKAAHPKPSPSTEAPIRPTTLPASRSRSRRWTASFGGKARPPLWNCFRGAFRPGGAGDTPAARNRRSRPRHRVPQRRASNPHALPASHRRPRFLPHRVGIDRRLGPLHVLRVGPGGDHPVVSGLPAPVYLLRPARVLGPLALRDPVKVVDEIEGLHRTQGITFFSIADENPTTRKDVWRRFLEEMTARKLPVYFFATIRATDVVRDRGHPAALPHAGLLYILMGIESMSEPVLERIRKARRPATTSRPADCSSGMESSPSSTASLDSRTRHRGRSEPPSAS